MPRLATIKNGDTFTNKKGQTATVVDYQNALNVIIKFDEGNLTKKVTSQQLRNQNFTNRPNNKPRQRSSDRGQQSLFNNV